MNEFSSNPPIPPPSGDSCPVCHAPLSGRPKFCPNCGAVLSQVSGGTSCWVTMASILLVMLALAFGGSGACLLLIVSMEGGNTKDSSGVFAAACMLAMIACIWAVWMLNRRKKK